MSQVVEAIFQNGVFKPLHPVDIKESEVVAIKVVSINEWQTKFRALIEKIHRKTAQFLIKCEPVPNYTGFRHNIDNKSLSPVLNSRSFVHRKRLLKYQLPIRQALHPRFT